MNAQKINPIKIAFVDDHTLLREALASVVDAYEHFHVILKAADGKELMDKLTEGNIPDLIILDVNMPGIDGYDTAKWLQKNFPKIHVLILTMYDSELPMIRLLQSGVKGFLKKDIHPSELRNAIETTMSTGFYYSGYSSSKLVNLLKNGDSNIPLINNINLTENEMKFLELASTELTYKQIAGKLKISPRTVENYRDSLFSKLDIKSRVGLVMFAIRNGVVKGNF